MTLQTKSWITTISTYIYITILLALAGAYFTIGGGSSNGNWFNHIFWASLLCSPVLLSYFIFKAIYKEKMKGLLIFLGILGLLPLIYILLFYLSS